jgi:hypothetical protein
MQCHAPMRFVCPACKHSQLKGGQCEKCGVDFVKYLTLMHFKMVTKAKQERERVKSRSEIIKQIFLLPITGGFSLLKFLRKRFRGE